jgi:hypothetical protein
VQKIGVPMTGQNSELENRQEVADRGMIKIKASKAPKFKKGGFKDVI